MEFYQYLIGFVEMKLIYWVPGNNCFVRKYHVCVFGGYVIQLVAQQTVVGYAQRGYDDLWNALKVRQLTNHEGTLGSYSL